MRESGGDRKKDSYPVPAGVFLIKDSDLYPAAPPFFLEPHIPTLVPYSSGFFLIFFTADLLRLMKQIT